MSELQVNITHNKISSLAYSDSDTALKQMIKITDDLKHEYENRESSILAINQAQHEVLMRLALAAEYRDEDTGMHIIRIGYMAELLSSLMGKAEEFCFMIRLAAPLHDVGNIGIPDLILKSSGKLNEAERNTMNTHSEIGYKILSNSDVPLFQLAATIALTHHEKFDGSGYPNKLVGEFIPFAGRVVAIVDYFDALTMDRFYRKAFSNEVVIQMVHDQTNKHFDPHIVKVFLSHISVFIQLRQKINLYPFKYHQLIKYPLDNFFAWE
jgi:putative two-component system response regulator